MANFPLMGTLAPSVSSLPRPKRDWRASLFDRLNPQGIPGLELDDAEKAKLGRQSLLNAGLAMLQTRGQGIGGTLAAGLSQGLLSARQGP